MKAYLHKLVERNAVPSSLLFTGPKNSEKEAVAEEFAKLLIASNLSHHPDLHRFHPEGKVGMHSLESIRLLREEAYLPPFQAKRKVFLIFEAERMLPYSANALLKIFEEPPPYNTIVLISTYPEKLLPTILSRCHTLRFQGEAIHAITSNKQLVDLLIHRKSLSYPQMIRGIKQLVADIEVKADNQIPKELTAFQAQQLEKQKEGSAAIQQHFAAEELFEQILAWFRDLLLVQLNGDLSLLYHSSKLNELKQACQKGEFIPLEKMQKAVSDAKLSLERSTPLQHVFEYFFLNL